MAKEVVIIRVSNSDLLPVGKAAKALGLTRNTLYVWLRQKKIIGVKLGEVQFIPQSEVDRLKKPEK